MIYYKDDEDDDAGRSSKYNLMDKTKERKADKEVSWGRVLFWLGRSAHLPTAKKEPRNSTVFHRHCAIFAPPVYKNP